MTTKARKVHTCTCGREFTNKAGMLNHGKACPVEQARSQAFVAALVAHEDPWAAGWAAVAAFQGRA